MGESSQVAAARLWMRVLALPLLADCAHRGTLSIRDVAVTALSAVMLVHPRVGVLVAIAAVDVAMTPLVPFREWLVHGYVTYMISLSVVIAAAVVALQRRRLLDESDVMTLLRYPALTLATGVFFTGLAKLNDDFLDPAISCGGVYYSWYSEFPVIGAFVPTGTSARLAAIWGTIVLELVGPVLCLFRSTRRIGLVMIWLLTVLLAGNPRALYFEFVGLFWVCSLFWVPPETLRRVSERLAAMLPTRVQRAPLSFEVAVAGVALGLVVISHTATSSLHWTLYAWRHVAVVVVSGTSTMVLRYWVDEPPSVTGAASTTPWRHAMWVVPLLFVTNEVLPYGGFPHSPGLMMAANALPRRSRTNHLLIRHLPPLPGGQDVTILGATGLPGVTPGMHAELDTFRHILRDHPDATVTYQIEGDATVHRLSTPAAVRAEARWSPIAALFGTQPHGLTRSRYLCEKREPGLTPDETRQLMLQRLEERDGPS